MDADVFSRGASDDPEDPMALWVTIRRVFTTVSALGLALYAYYLIQSWKRKKELQER